MVVVLILSVFSRMSVTNNIEKYLMDTEDTRYGWSYEIMTDEGVTAVEPEFLDKYTMVLPGGEDAKAVKITRTFTETLPEASLEWTSYNSAVEVLIEGELIYSDFQTKERNEAGFLLLWQEEIDQIRPEKTVKISLPWKYTGMELTMITYFGEGAEGASPVYPFVKNDRTEYAMYVTDSV